MIDINVDCIQSIRLLEKRMSELKYYDAVPKRTRFFGWFVMQYPLKAGFQSEGYSWFERDPIENYEGKEYMIEMDLKPVLYYAPTAIIDFVGGQRQKLFFKTNEEMYHLVETLKEQSKGNFIRIYE